jgi:hypothetical protein
MLFKIAGATVLGFALMASSGSSHHGTAPDDSCGVIEEALQETGKLKPGITRDKVEASFILDGGLNFVMTSRYSFRKCRSIKLDVEFSDRAGGSPKDFSSTDRVVKVSRPYLEYPAFD